MWMSGEVMLSRTLEKDAKHIAAAVQGFPKERTSWLVIFPEGTRSTPKNLASRCAGRRHPTLRCVRKLRRHSAGTDWRFPCTRPKSGADISKRAALLNSSISSCEQPNVREGARATGAPPHAGRRHGGDTVVIRGSSNRWKWYHLFW